jgi:hypothetical protein
VIATAAACIPTLIFQSQVRLPAIAMLPITGVVYSSIFLALILIFGALTEDEAVFMTGWAQRFIALKFSLQSKKGL